jgi:hypothetical protein
MGRYMYSGIGLSCLAIYGEKAAMSAPVKLALRP